MIRVLSRFDAPTCILWVSLIAVFPLLCLQLFVAPRTVPVDDGGFVNPILQSVQSEHVTYPAHGPDHAQRMVIHPPVHYWLTARLMRLGVRLYPALGLLVLAQVLILAWATARAQFTDAWLV